MVHFKSCLIRYALEFEKEVSAASLSLFQRQPAKLAAFYDVRNIIIL
jgi:hypothetical protein